MKIEMEERRALNGAKMLVEAPIALVHVLDTDARLVERLDEELAIGGYDLQGPAIAITALLDDQQECRLGHDGTHDLSEARKGNGARLIRGAVELAHVEQEQATLLEGEGKVALLDATVTSYDTDHSGM